MGKYRVSIDINDVLRNFTTALLENLENDLDLQHFDLFDLDKFATQINISDEESVFFDFINNTEEVVKKTKHQVLMEFFMDKGFNIFAKNENKTYRNVFTDLNNYIKQNPDYDFTIFSNEVHPLLGYTLSFLSSNPTICGKYILDVKNPKEIWSKSDLVITANPNIIASKPPNKKVIKVLKEYNKDIYKKCQTIEKIKELL